MPPRVKRVTCNHDVAISCDQHAAALARARRDAKGVTHDGDQQASSDRVHLIAGELRARAARDPSPVPAHRIRAPNPRTESATWAALRMTTCTRTSQLRVSASRIVGFYCSSSRACNLQLS